ncbi:MAG: PDZ domain-containing protein [Phycisphaerales bacterium]
MPLPPRVPLPRRVGLAALILALAWVAIPACAARHDDAQGLDQLRRDTRRLLGEARDRVYPALVHISVVTVHYWDGKEIKGRSTGSGTIISPDGYVLTNQHVTDGGESFICTLADRREVPATLVGEDALTDLAVLRLDMDVVGDAALPVAEFGDSGGLAVGDYVLAMGSPFSLSRSVTLGIVSNTSRVFGGGVGASEIEEIELESGQRTGIFTTWIQHDALIHPGNSGGPLVNLRGEIVGVNELGGSAMGFAIPSNLSRQVSASLIEHGRVPRSWIGLSIRPIRGSGRTDGALVSSVIEDSPSGRAGLQPGDIVLGIDGDPITVRFVEEIPPFLKRIAEAPIGSTLAMAIERDGERIDIPITTEPMQEDLGEERALRAWGLTVGEITPRMAMRRRLTSTDGVLITSVRSGGPADQAEPALAPGDVILGIEGRRAANLGELVDHYREIIDAGDAPERFLLEFDRDGQNHYTLVRPDDGSSVDPPRELPKAWLGVATQPVVSRLAERLGLPEQGGYRITRIYPGTTAADTDLRIGDLIVSIDDTALRPRSQEDSGLLARAVRRRDIGDASVLTVLRDGAPVEFEVALEGAPMPPSEAKREQNRDFELSVRDLTFYDRDQNRWRTEQTGVIVERVDTGGWADAGGLRPGELILEIDGDAVADVDDFRRIMDAIADTKPARVEVVTLRGASTRVLYIEPEWGPDAPIDDNDPQS